MMTCSRISSLCIFFNYDCIIFSIKIIKIKWIKSSMECNKITFSTSNISKLKLFFFNFYLVKIKLCNTKNSRQNSAKRFLHIMFWVISQKIKCNVQMYFRLDKSNKIANVWTKWDRSVSWLSNITGLTLPIEQICFSNRSSYDDYINCVHVCIKSIFYRILSFIYILNRKIIIIKLTRDKTCTNWIIIELIFIMNWM